MKHFFDENSYRDAMATTVEVLVEEQNAYWETTCWGCKFQLTLPQFAPIFKCGYCGAVTVYKSGHKSSSRWRSRCGSVLDRCLVTLAFFLVLFIVYGGVRTMFPILFPSYYSVGFFFHSGITALLAFNTFFNLVFAAFVPAGPPPPVEWGQFEVVDRGGLNNYKFCARCEKPKPPAAHHCSTCRACVMEMDHHCPFIGNCVGADNQGYFILFLLFTTLSCLYVLGMAVYTYKVHLRMIAYQFPEPGAWLDYFTQVVTSLLAGGPSTYIRCIALLYLFIVSVALLIGVSILLYQQLSLLYQGQTYLDTLLALSTESASGQQRKGWANVRRVFGKRKPWLWLLPSISSKKSHSR